METRRTFVALALALAVYLLYTTVYNRLRPPPRPAPPTAQLGATQPAAGPPTAGPPTAATQPTGPARATQPTTGPELRFVAAPEIRKLTLGSPDDPIEVELTSAGAAIETIRLTARRKDGQYVHRRDIKSNEPYVLIKPVPGPEGPICSYLTHRLWLGERSWPLDRLVWDVVVSEPHRAVFQTTLAAPDGSGPILRLTKSYELEPGTARVRLGLEASNLSSEPLRLQLEQDGPIGIAKEHLQYDMRRLIVGRWDGERVDTIAKQRRDLAKQVLELGGALAEKPLLWIALSNKYFAVYTRPLPEQDRIAGYVEKLEGTVALPGDVEPHPGDLLARMRTAARQLNPGQSVAYAFELYAGTKNEKDLERANPAYADRRQIGFVAARDADQRCCCTFPFLTSLMTWMLEGIYFGVRNYGVAIIILVVIIRAVLHPLAVFQQKSMYRMQEAQSRLQPKINELKEKYRNDRTRLNQEMMKLYSEEGVNPMAGLIGMLPLAIQMPILIALWTALNTDVHLRHAGFDPWWITDLSAPDALIEFGGDGVTIPILGWLPLIGRWFSNIKSLNLLPILMGVSMWLQQKYMPKPAMQARLEAAKQAPKTGGMSPQDQLRQQQMIAYVMSILFPLMFYNWPSGLNLYWMATNVFGIGESLLIRKQLQREKERREREGPAVRRKPGPVGELFRRLAARAQELQKRADQLAREEPGRRAPRGGSQRKR